VSVLQAQCTSTFMQFACVCVARDVSCSTHPKCPKHQSASVCHHSCNGVAAAAQPRAGGRACAPSGSMTRRKVLLPIVLTRTLVRLSSASCCGTVKSRISTTSMSTSGNLARIATISSCWLIICRRSRWPAVELPPRNVTRGRPERSAAERSGRPAEACACARMTRHVSGEQRKLITGVATLRHVVSIVRPCPAIRCLKRSHSIPSSAAVSARA
jgi:hypothetical protein